MRVTTSGVSATPTRTTAPDAPAPGSFELAPVTGQPTQFTFKPLTLPFNGGKPILRARYQAIFTGGGGWTGAYDMTGLVPPVEGVTYTVTLLTAQLGKTGRVVDIRFWYVNELSQSNSNLSPVTTVSLAPSLSAVLDDATNQTTGNVSFSTTGVAGDVYGTFSASLPADGAAVKAASQAPGFPLAISSLGSKSVGLTGLTSNTAYNPIRLAQEVSTGVFSPVASGDGFTTPAAPDTLPPTILSVTPAVGATDTLVTSNIDITFSENISFGTGNILLRKYSGSWSTVATYDVTSASEVSISGAVLTINPGSSLDFSSQYAVQIAATAVKDASNNFFAGITNDTTITFTTVSDVDVTITYTPGTGMQVYRAFDDMVEAGWVRPQDETLSSQIFTIGGSPSGIAGANGYLQIDTSTVADTTFDYTVSWSDSVCDPGGGSFTWRIRRVVAYPTTMRIGHLTPVNTPARGRAVGPPSTTSIVSQTLLGSPVTLFAITDSGGHARLHFATGASTPTPGDVYVVTLNTGVVTVTIDSGTTVSTLTEAQAVITSAAGGSIVYLREGRTSNAPDTIHSQPSAFTIGRTTDDGTYVTLTKHSDDSAPILGRISMGGTATVQKVKFQYLTFEANMSGNSQGLPNVFYANAKQYTTVDNCLFHGQRRTNGNEGVSGTSSTNLRTYITASAGCDYFTLSNCEAYDAREFITVAGATNVQIEDNIIRRTVFDFVGTSRCRGLTIRGNRMADPLFAYVDMPLQSAPVAGPVWVDSNGNSHPTINFSVADATSISGVGNAEDKAWAWGCRSASSDLYSYTTPEQMVAVDLSSSPHVITVAYTSAGVLTPRTNLLNNYTSGGILRASASRLHGDFIQIGKPTPVPATWNVATAYTAGAVVASGGRYYTCTADNTGQTPATGSAYWVDSNFQTDITVEGNAFVRGTGIPGRNSGQGIYSAKSEVPKENILIRGNLVYSVTDKGIYITRIRNGQVISNSTVIPLGTNPTQFTTKCELTANAETGYSVDVYDNVCNGLTTANAVGVSTNYNMPQINQQFSWPENATDVTNYDAVFVDVPVREQTLKKADFWNLFDGEAANANMYPSGQPARGWKGEFDPATGVYSGPR